MPPRTNYEINNSKIAKNGVCISKNSKVLLIALICIEINDNSKVLLVAITCVY